MHQEISVYNEPNSAELLIPFSLGLPFLPRLISVNVNADRASHGLELKQEDAPTTALITHTHRNPPDRGKRIPVERPQNNVE